MSAICYVLSSNGRDSRLHFHAIALIARVLAKGFPPTLLRCGDMREFRSDEPWNYRNHAICVPISDSMVGTNYY